MPLKNSRSSLNSHFADARASKISGTSLEGRVCSEAPLSRLKQPIFSEVASWVGICHTESGNRARSAEGTVKSQNRAMWQSPGPAVKQWQHLGTVSHYEGGVLTRDEGHKNRGRQGQVCKRWPKPRRGHPYYEGFQKRTPWKMHTCVPTLCSWAHATPHRAWHSPCRHLWHTERTEKQRAPFKQLHAIATMSVKLSLFQ